MECVGDELGKRRGGSGRGRGCWLVGTVEEVVDIADTYLCSEEEGKGPTQLST